MLEKVMLGQQDGIFWGEVFFYHLYKWMQLLLNGGAFKSW